MNNTRNRHTGVINFMKATILKDGERFTAACGRVYAGGFVGNIITGPDGKLMRRGGRTLVRVHK